MADGEKQYRATLTLHVQDEDSGRDVIDVPITYTDLPYGALIVLEHALLGVLDTMLNLGVKSAVVLGQGDVFAHNPKLAAKVEELSGEAPDSE